MTVDWTSAIVLVIWVALAFVAFVVLIYSRRGAKSVVGGTIEFGKPVPKDAHLHDLGSFAQYATEDDVVLEPPLVAGEADCDKGGSDTDDGGGGGGGHGGDSGSGE